VVADEVHPGQNPPVLAPFSCIIVFLLAVRGSAQQQDLPVAPPDVQAFVREALQDRLNADAIPDFHLLAHSPRVALRAEMPVTGLRLTEVALPRHERVDFYLLSTAVAQAQADRAGQDVFFVIVDLPEIHGETASLKMGSDVVIHRDPSRQMIKMCCCDGIAVFDKVDGKWVFARWERMICR
jgi:hypothetical protein